MDIDKLIVEHPVIQNMINCDEIFWLNEKAGQAAELPFGMADIEEAEARLARFAPYIMAAFPETEETGGIIESPLVEITRMKKLLQDEMGKEFGEEGCFSSATAIWPCLGPSKPEAASMRS